MTRPGVLAGPVAAAVGFAWLVGLAGLVAALARCSDAVTSADGGCTSDQDGLSGGSATFDLTVDDTAFSPIILKAQNRAKVTLTLRNTGTQPHDFVLGCIPTPNASGCPATSCFGDGGSLPAVAPDASATTTFVTPSPEGIYVFRSDLGSDSRVAADGGVSGLAGQFIVQ